MSSGSMSTTPTTPSTTNPAGTPPN
jgi:hypothetical protein